MSEVLRCFIAIKMPAEATERLREAQERLQAAEPEWKWVDPTTFHITLKFLGYVERERLDLTWLNVQAVVQGTLQFSVALRGLGVFPGIRAPRVAWAGISQGGEEMAALAVGIEEVCSRHGFEPEKRPFSPHLTLGRARLPRPSPTLAAVVGEFAQTELGGGKIDEVLLMQSTLQRTGAIYTVIGGQPLRSGDNA